MQSDLAAVYAWYAATIASEIPPALCVTRDQFQARLETMHRTVHKQGVGDETVALLTAILGELGNNCFDHNLGQWQDAPGCWFAYYTTGNAALQAVIADRGQGIRASLQRVDASLTTDQAALDAAFQRRISGRAPEQRGNGLKFVRQVVNDNPGRGLCCVSGNGIITFGGLAAALMTQIEGQQQQQTGRGVFTVVRWETVDEN